MRTLTIGNILTLIIGLHGCTYFGKPHEDTIRLNGFTVSVPSGEEWIRTDGSPTEASFERAKNGEKTVLRLSIDTLGTLPQGQTFFGFAESRQEQSFAGLEMVSIHYNRTSKENAPCLQYDGIFESKAKTMSPFTTIRGFICRHPDEPNRILQAELSQQSNSKDVAYTIDLTETARQVFNSIQFTKDLDTR